MCMQSKSLSQLNSHPVISINPWVLKHHASGSITVMNFSIFRVHMGWAVQFQRNIIHPSLNCCDNVLIFSCESLKGQLGQRQGAGAHPAAMERDHFDMLVEIMCFMSHIDAIHTWMSALLPPTPSLSHFIILFLTLFSVISYSYSFT